MHTLKEKKDLQKLVKKVYEYTQNEETQLKEFKALCKNIYNIKKD